ncbi:Nif3-like dinuclear metal center hexameric protein [Methanococcus voltae]|uniref:NGG1p interacting factor 3 protein, NIF3 n=1 Tax=Methanococcus voltae (strain ATCC BAA-1334 / A3) TaxID=456320 RepID=D7DV74_METV3|nr:Nif3-like dinuclear metal center hexameric protein [Methanococcus voltae]MCS3901923.1 dinuclear metal center YbgI/SA1388 family protein [Methanococcus voltae]
MVKANEIISHIEKYAPKELAIPGDNIGIQVCDSMDKKINKIGVALDPSLDVIKKASQNNVDFLFTHHPIMKDPVRTFQGPLYEKLKILMGNGIILYSAHTNLDICKDGLNDELAKLYHLENVKNLYEDGLGRIGTFKGTVGELIKITEQNICSNPYITNYEHLKAKHTLKVAILSGYGLSQKSIEYVSKVADVYISGDLTHHSEILAIESKLCVIDGTHYGTEVYGLKNFMKKLEKLNCEIISLDF